MSDDELKLIGFKELTIEDDFVGHNSPSEVKSQNTVELTSMELKANTKDQSKTWARHQSEVAVHRLEREASAMRKDLNARRERLARVEAQINHISKGDDGLHGHGGVGGLRSHALWIIAGIVTGLLKLSFCVVFGSVIHESAGDLLSNTIPIGVGVQLVSAFVTCLITAKFSTVGISISGPDIIQALMLANMAKVIEKKMEAGDEDGALATILFLSILSTVFIAVTWLIIVKYHLMVVLDFFPVSVVTGFLGCIGYKVVEEAIHIAVGKAWYYPGSMDFWKLLLPIFPLGLPLFLLKRFHIGSPIFVFPFFVIGSIVMFFVVIYGAGLNLNEMRKQGWMFQEMESGVFYEQWTKLDFKLINVSVVIACIPDILILTLVITLDAFLKLSSTRTELQASFMDIEKELEIAGYQSLVSAACVGTVGYSQIKFNVLNFAIVNDMSDRRPCAFVGLLCGLVWFAGFPLTNWLPRFFLAGLLLYAGLPFLDMVISAYWRVTKKEFCAILIIVLVNAVSEIYVTWSLLIAVIVGLLLATIIFMVQYSRVSVIRDVISGKDFSSTVVRSYAEQSLVERLGVRYMILELQGFLFFGTARQVLDWVKQKDKSNSALPLYQRLRYIAIDFTHVENMDYSCAKTFADIMDNINEMGCQLLYVGMNEKVSSKLEDTGFGTLDIQTFKDLDYAAEYIEDSLLERASFIRLHWLVFDSFRKLHTRALLMATYEIFEAVLGSDIGRRIWRYAEQREFKRGEFLCKEGHINHTLFLLQCGKVTSITKKPDGTTKRLHTMRRGAFFNEECLFLDRPVSYSSVADEDSVVWAIDRTNMKDLEAHDPFLAAEILRNVLRVSSMARMRLEREVSALETSTLKSSKSASSGFGQSILAEISAPKFRDVDPQEPRRSHQFQHISVERLSGPTELDDQKSKILDCQPHLSRPMQKDVMDCFIFHSTHKTEYKSNKPHRTQPKRSLGRAQFFSSASNREFRDPFDPEQNAGNSLASDGSGFGKASDRRIKIKELQKAVMDLGYFPTVDEIQKMHNTLGPSMMQRIAGDEHEHGADIHEFIKMLEVLSFAELTQQQRRLLYNLFKKHDRDNHLWRDGLASLMKELGHPEDELELEMLMHEWDCNQQGYLTFGDFISIVAQVIKTEELDAKVETDFLTVCGKRVEEIETNKVNLLKSNTHITAADLIRVGRERGMGINPEIAEEMIFDASETPDRMVSLTELITTIETVYRNESLPAKKKNERMTMREIIPGFMMNFQKNQKSPKASTKASML